MSNYLFEIVIESGFLWKSFVDFIYNCITNTKLHLKIDPINGIRVIHPSDKSDQNKYVIFCSLDKNRLQRFKIEKSISLYLDPKRLYKICRTIKKKDVITLSMNSDVVEKNCNMLMTIRNENSLNTYKQIPIPAEFLYEGYTNVDNNQKLFETEKQKFNDYNFCLKSSQIQELKKEISSNSDVELYIQEDNFVKFVYSNQSITPSEYISGIENKTKDTFNMTLKGTMIKILSKTTPLSSNLNFYTLKNKEDKKALRVSVPIDIPSYFGFIDIFIYE